MPLPRRRSSHLGQQAPSASAAGGGSLSRASAGVTAAPRGVFVGTAPTGGASGLGTRVSRRALGISSVFLQGMRSSAAPVLPQQGELGHRQVAFEGLNGSLLEYRDKVHALEQLNRQLEQQIRQCLDRKASSAGNWGVLRQDWEEIYQQVSEAILDNARLMLQTENLQAGSEDFKDRYENEQPFRKAVEEEIDSLYKVIDDANLTQADLEAQIQNMRAELEDLDRAYEEEVRTLYRQLAGPEANQPDAPIETSLDQILSYIRSHWERAIERNRVETDLCPELKRREDPNAKLSREQEEIATLKAECSDSSCKIQSLQAETESLRALKRGLENSMCDARHWHDIEQQNLGSVISKLEAELGDIRADIEQQRRDYETLLGNKTRLELEIGTYHGILDGEESRCSGIPGDGEGVSDLSLSDAINAPPPAEEPNPPSDLQNES